MNVITSGPPRPTPSAQQPVGRPNNLYRSGIALLLGSLVYYLLSSRLEDKLHLVLGLAMLVMGSLPALRWTKDRQTTIPIFAILVLTTLPTYALPLLNGHAILVRFHPDVITKSAVLVLLFQATAIVVHSTMRPAPGRGEFYEVETLDARSRPWIIACLVVVTVYTIISVFTSVIPGELISILRPCFAGLGVICSFVAMRDWGRGTLSPALRVFVATLLALQIISYISSLVLVAGISILCLALIGYVSGSRKIPILFLAIIIPVVAVLHNGKGTMRAKYWPSSGSTQHEQVTFSKLPEIYSEWFNAGLSSNQEDNARMRRPEDLTAGLIDRSSLFHMLCLVVHYTPDRQPHMNGSTYADIPGQFIPRILWPGKPQGHVSTSRLSVYYGLQREEETSRTTIGFGMLCEAYANFGYAGIAGLGLLLGASFRWIEGRTALSPLLSPAGLLMIQLAAWSFQTEMPMSLWVSSFAQASIFVIGLPVAVHKLFG